MWDKIIEVFEKLSLTPICSAVPFAYIQTGWKDTATKVVLLEILFGPTNVFKS